MTNINDLDPAARATVSAPERYSPKSTFSAVVSIIGAVLFFLPVLFNMAMYGLATALDFGRISTLSALGELAGLIAFVAGIISVFASNGRNRRAALGIVLGGFVAFFPYLLILIVAMLRG
ncbi:MAG TPA: hypothetical protein VGS13_05370 [Stellaceae bacterium]|nr:hypothetical protein [Stellaceae bacterium]